MFRYALSFESIQDSLFFKQEEEEEELESRFHLWIDPVFAVVMSIVKVSLDIIKRFGNKKINLFSEKKTQGSNSDLEQ